MGESAVFYFSGGTMRGIFGAGVATGIQEANLYPYIASIYGGSAGTLVGSYLYSMQTRLGSSIFYQDLVRDFISVSNFFGGMYDRLVHRYIRHRKSLRDAVNLDTLFYAVTRSKQLHLDKIVEMPLWVKVLELESRTIRYFRIDEHPPLALLRASVSLMPYVSTPVRLGDKHYVDAGIVEPVGIKTLRQRHPEEKIVVVYNGEVRWTLKNELRGRIEGAFAHMMHGSGYYQLFAECERNVQQDLAHIAEDPRILLVSCPGEAMVATRTCDRAQLMRAYEAGIRATPAIAAFLR